MLVVISDLHMEEESSHTIHNAAGDPIVTFSRNLSPKAYLSIIATLATEVQRNNATEMHLVLAGDVFELTRTALWFRDPLRPYTHNEAIDGALEAKIIDILEAIAAQPAIDQALTVFRELQQGIYRNGKREEPFPCPVTLYYLPGNHDRIANATPAIRRKVRALLGMPITPEPFHHQLHFANEFAFIRHGHEYDFYNFGADHRETTLLPRQFAKDDYDKPCFGDFVTIDFAARLPVMLRQVYGDEAVATTPLLRAVYERLIAFDDLRPQSAVLQYLLHMPEVREGKQAIWEVLERVFVAILEESHDNEFALAQLKGLSRGWLPDMYDVAGWALATKFWRRLRVPLWLVEFLSQRMVQQVATGAGAEDFAKREEIIQQGKARFLIAGHTHRPQVALLQHDAEAERYFIDTGTWRNRVPANADYTAFGRLKTLTYITIYGSDEDLGSLKRGVKVASVDAWTGFTQRW